MHSPGLTQLSDTICPVRLTQHAYRVAVRITYEARPAYGYGPYVPYSRPIQDYVSLSWVSPSNGNVEYMDRQGSRHPLSHAETPYRISRDISHVPAVGRAHMRPIPHVAPELRLTSHLRTRLFKSVLRDMIEQLASRRAYAHVYPPPITKPLLIPTRAHPPPIVLGYITLCCHRFCDTIALCRGNPKRNDTGACTTNTASCAQSIKTPPRHWSSATHSSSLSPL